MTMRQRRLSLGSPPRMRGKPISAWNRLAKLRITPAYAGKTYNRQVEKVSTQDHPRVCGENRDFHQGRCGSGGSPPRMRGKLLSSCFVPIPERITPAYAGKTVCKIGQLNLKQDHPRVCGENVEFYENLLPGQGSPPRMRGKLTRSSPSKPENRITPAYAGKTSD